MKILDKFSAAATSAPSVSIDFDLISVDVMESTKDTLSGSVVLYKDSYKLTLPNNIVWYNGKTSWSYLQKEQEVTITEPEMESESFTGKPSLIFTAYKDGYKCRLVEESAKSYMIDLYPEDVKSDLVRIRLSIEKSNNKLISFEYKTKDGYTATLYTKKYDLTFKPDANTFTFLPEKYRNADVIDMR